MSVAWLAVGAAFGLTAAGAAHPTIAVAPVAVVTPNDVVAADDGPAVPHDPTAARRWPAPLTTSVQMQPIPAFVGVDDPAGAGPAPPTDPAVARLLALLAQEAKGSPTDLRPGAEALAALDFALAQVGRPYVWGAIGPDSYDCSGLTWRAYETAGVALPRVSADQHASGGVPVAIANLIPGDLVFFATAAWDPGAVHHVGMYVGRGLMVDAPHPGGYVRVEPVTAAGYVGAIRVVAARPASADLTASPSPSTTPTGTGSARPTGSPSAVATDPPGTSGGLPLPPSAPPSDTPTATPTATDPPTDPPTDPSTVAPTDPTSAQPSGSVTAILVTGLRALPPGG